MKLFLGIFLGTIVAVLIIAVVLYFIIVSKIKKVAGNEGFKQIKDRLKQGMHDGEVFDGSFEAEHRSISGMTDLLEVKVRRDFEDFHASELFNLNNKNLKAIFNTLEDKNISYLDNDSVYDLIKSSVYEQIVDMKNRNIEVAYDDVKINRNSIKSYTNKDGTATIEVNTSMSYFYRSNNKKEKQFDKYRKETRFVTKYILVYDASKLDEDQQFSISVNCPNCGAPVPVFGDTKCKYCDSLVKGVNINTINLKSWRLISYKEY
ncbi:MAG: zinc ribbon domain-containing protein [Bacilli bacterium]|nr:zinc ribbon domain-containing protein [Bacilli bacterium]